MFWNRPDLTHFLSAEGKDHWQACSFCLAQDVAQQVIQPSLTLYLLDVGGNHNGLGAPQLDRLGHLPATPHSRC